MPSGYLWITAGPGNVRELENAIEHAFVLCANDQISIFDLPMEIRQMEFRPLTAEQYQPSTAHIRRKISKPGLLELLYECGWNKAEVARRIGKSRTAVWKYMKKVGYSFRNAGKLYPSRQTG